MKKEDYLKEFQTIADTITNKFINDFKDSDLEANEYINTVADSFKNRLAEKGTEIFHKSISQGFDDNSGLIAGIQKINFDSVMNLKKNILR